GGCVLPIWRHERLDAESRANLPGRVPERIVVGETRRVEVLLELGEPDVAAPDERWFAYGATRTAGAGVLVLAAGGGQVGGFTLTRGHSHADRLVVRFDAAGTVTSAELGSFECRKTDFSVTSGDGATFGCRERLLATVELGAGAELKDQAGPVVARHPYAVRATGPCERGPDALTLTPGELVVGERGLYFASSDAHRPSTFVSLAGLTLLTPEGHFGYTWTGLREADGRCTFVSLKRGRLGLPHREDQQRLVDELTPLIARQSPPPPPAEPAPEPAPESRR
ncbi:MAG: hypothetical protein JSR54_14355, partial [Proteobacteria bacterium]|nr:hypothetical protein [Pseudomonadota bacterium]